MPPKLQHPVPEHHLIEIGDITVSFALLEFSIQHLISSFINEHQRIGKIVCVELSFKNLRALGISLYLEKFGEDDDYKSLRNFMKRAGKIEEQRNQIIHSIWTAGKDKNHVNRNKTTAKEKDGLKFKSEEYSVERLSNLATQIKILAFDVQQFWLHLLETSKTYNNPAKGTSKSFPV